MIVTIQLPAGDAQFLGERAKAEGRSLESLIEEAMGHVVTNLNKGKGLDGYWSPTLTDEDITDIERDTPDLARLLRRTRQKRSA